MIFPDPVPFAIVSLHKVAMCKRIKYIVALFRYGNKCPVSTITLVGLYACYLCVPTNVNFILRKATQGLLKATNVSIHSVR